MAPSTFNQAFADFKDYQFFPQDPDAKKPADNPAVPRFARSSYQVAEVVCGDATFAVGKTAEGKYVYLGKNHVCLAETLDELRGECNAVERSLLPA